MWAWGELVHIEDLVLHDAHAGIRTQTHELTIAHAILRSRRRIAAAEPDWAVSMLGITSLAGKVGAGDKAVLLHVMNEYMAVDDKDGGRVATFPSVITTLSEEGLPLSVGELREGMKIFILHVPMNIIPLSTSVLDPTVYPPVETAMGIEIAKYVQGVK